jgi:predicted outer membrane repeat protein
VSLGDTGAGSGTTGDLRYAITQANSTPGPNTINFAVSGTIQLQSALPDLSNNIDMIGPGAGSLTLTPAAGTPEFSLLTVDSGESVTISGLTLSGAHASVGAGICDNGSTLNVDNCLFTGNAADTAGGAIYVGLNSACTIDGSTIANNTAGFEGGGVDGNILSTVTVINSTFASNQGADGGAIYSFSSIAIAGSTFADNSASQSGGALYAYDNDNVFYVTITGSTFSGNEALGSGGGDGNGGAIWFDGLAVFSNTLSITDSTIANNSAMCMGGGIWWSFDTGSTVDISYDTIVQNSVTDTDTDAGGGGIFIGSDGTQSQYVNDLIADNWRTMPGFSGEDDVMDVNGTFDPSTWSYNLVGSGAGTTLVNGQNDNIIGSPAAPINPLVGPLQNNGGPTETMALLPGSAALNAGNPTGASATDQRGLPRVVNGQIDIGAYQTQAVTDSLTVVTAQTLAVNENSTAGGNVLTGAVDSASNPISAVAGTFITANGLVTINADGSYAYTPNAGYAGSDSFTFTAQTADTSAGGTVNVTVNQVDDLTVVTPQSLTVIENNSGMGNVLTGAIDSEGGAISTVAGTFATANGSVTIQANGSYAYTPNAGFVGNDSFPFTAQTADDGTSGTVNVTVNPQLQSATALTSSANPAVYGQNISLTATVTAATGSGTPTGSVIFMDGNNALGSATLNSSGVATLGVSLTALATNHLTATYSGDSTFESSTSSTLSQTVNKAASSVTLTSSSVTAVFGQSLTFTARVSAASPGSGTPTGTVTFYSGSTVLGTATLNGGVATFTTSALTVGSHTIKATYGGNADFTGGSKSLTQTVKKDSTKVAASYNAGTLTATVTVVSPGSGTPTGTVTFKDTTTGTVLGTATLHNGTATLTGVTLAKGTHKISVTYSGDGDDLASSTTLTLSV